VQMKEYGIEIVNLVCYISFVFRHIYVIHPETDSKSRTCHNTLQVKKAPM
jgi:hypothetical protein